MQQESRQSDWWVYCDAMLVMDRALQGSESSESNLLPEIGGIYCYCYHCILQCDSTSKAILQLKRKPTSKPGFLTETSKAPCTVQISPVHYFIFHPNLRPHRALANLVLLLMPKPPAEASLGFPFPGVPLPFAFPYPTPIFTSTLSLHAFTVSSS